MNLQQEQAIARMGHSKTKRNLLILIAGCVIMPQVILYFNSAPKKQRFMVLSKKEVNHEKIYELRKPKSFNPDIDNPAGIEDYSNSIEEGNPNNKVVKVVKPNFNSKFNSKYRNKKKTAISKNDPDVQPFIDAFNDELPLIDPDPNCHSNYTEYQTDSYCLPNLHKDAYFDKYGKVYCMKEGTVSVSKNGNECRCKIRWHGPSCSMHDVVYNSEYPRGEYAYLVSMAPHRVINAFPFTHEFDLLETRMHELDDAVDVYLIGESNYTAAGHPRPRLLLTKLKSGYLKEYQHKIVYVPLGYFPKKGYYNGWVMDALLRNHIGEGLKRIKNLKENDVFVINDADELPKRETLLFLKLHHGYPEPIGFHLVHNVYGFFWRGTDKITHVFGACTIAMLYHFFNWEPYRLRSATHQINKEKAALDHFKYKHLGTVREWSFGQKEKQFPSGWHCSWCFKPAGIKSKLESAHWSDLPRWGAYPSKTTLEYIGNLTQRGMWFDDRTKLLPSEFRLSDWYAPKYLKQNLKRYRHLMIKPGE